MAWSGEMSRSRDGTFSSSARFHPDRPHAQRIGKLPRYRLDAEPGHGNGPAVRGGHQIAALDALDRHFAARRRDQGSGHEADRRREVVIGIAGVAGCVRYARMDAVVGAGQGGRHRRIEGGAPGAAGHGGRLGEQHVVEGVTYLDLDRLAVGFRRGTAHLQAIGRFRRSENIVAFHGVDRDLRRGVVDHEVLRVEWIVEACRVRAVGNDQAEFAIGQRNRGQIVERPDVWIGGSDGRGRR